MFVFVDEAMLLVFEEKRLPVKLAKRLTGDEAFDIFETIVVDDGRLKPTEMPNYSLQSFESYVVELDTSVETIVFKP